MKSNANDFSPEESLQLIRSMIEKTKHSISDKSHYFLLWGWAVFIGSLLQYYLKVIIDYPQHYYAWYITPVTLVIFIVFLVRDSKKEKVKTFIDEASRYLWTGIGFSFMALGFIFSKMGWQYCYPIYILLYGIGTYVSGALIKFRPLIIGGIFCFPLAVIATYVEYDTQIITLAFAVLVSYIIPGYLLRMRYKKQQ
ncbi:MAG: hypothetical protein ABI921_09485 [Panacibacter sp.]